jgi:alkanesulfonate monooxygenase
MKVEAPRHEALTQQFDAEHFRIGAAPAAVADPSSSERPAFRVTLQSVGCARLRLKGELWSCFGLFLAASVWRALGQGLCTPDQSFLAVERQGAIDMSAQTRGEEVTLIGTCPVYNFQKDVEWNNTNIATAAKISEDQGWSSMLIYSDNRQLDPWVSADLLLRNSSKISPLVAVQPLYMHPYTLAKAVVSLSILYHRPINLNFISGGFPKDLEVFADRRTHDERYERLGEYMDIITGLLSRSPQTFQGKYFETHEMHLSLGIPPEVAAPLFTIAGSSPKGLQIAEKTGAVAVQYLRPSAEYDDQAFSSTVRHGTRLGIVARQNTQDAWNTARGFYPDDEIGSEIREYYVAISDSVWVRELAKEVSVPAGHPYWLGPYKNGYCACPFLVGSVEDVAEELIKYMRIGLRTFLIEAPRNEEDAYYITAAFALAKASH